MKIIVNDEEHEISAATLGEALEALNYRGAKVATAVNGCFVPITARAATMLADGDRIEILAPMRGG